MYVVGVGRQYIVAIIYCVHCEGNLWDAALSSKVDYLLKINSYAYYICVFTVFTVSL